MVVIAKCRKAEIPSDSAAHRFMPAGYADAFACGVTGGKKLSTDELMAGLWAGMPGWVDLLFRLRNTMVRPFGLKTGRSEAGTDGKILRNGNNTDTASVAAGSQNETVLKLSDKHLDAYLFIHLAHSGERQTVTAITLVHYHNRLGRSYFFFIRPFHGIIVKSLLRRAVRSRA